jgi:hypothetical protein
MNAFAALVSALALVVPAVSATLAPEAAHEAHSARSHPQVAGPRSEPDAFRAFRESFRPQRQEQVRIEQHVIIRITPTRPELRDQMFAAPPRSDRRLRFREEKHGRCVNIENISGISPMEPNRLVMFMRNHHMLSLALDRACDADAFYLGAYVVRSDDGKLCTGRDVLRARSGATCRVARITRLVALKD